MANANDRETTYSNHEDQDDYLEELSSDSASLTTASPCRGLISSHSSSSSSGVGSLSSEQNSAHREASDLLNERIYIDTTNPSSDLPPPHAKKWRITCGLLLMFFSIVTFVYTPFDLLMNERLRMMPGFPAFDWWLEPPDEVLLKVYIFNVTNGDEFLSGQDSVLRLEEVGPFVYLEKLVHTDVVFNNNSTITYTAHRTAVFQQHLTHISRNASLMVPNMAVLGGASHLASDNFIKRMGFSMMLRTLNSSPLTRISAQDYMWNWTDPVIATAKNLVPSMVPVENMGILQRIYSDFVDEVTVHIGTKNPRNFFLVDQFHGSNRLGYWEGEECDNMQGSTEGVTYPEFLTRKDPIRYLRKTICRVATLYYTRDVIQDGMLAYRWELPHNTYHRPPHGSVDCFTKEGEEPLPSGISDMSPCYYQYPISISLPHLLGASPDVEPKISGMEPNDTNHGSYVIIEPLTGIPMESRARSQVNLVVKKLAGYSARVSRFSNMIVPMFWLEYGQQGLPSYVSSLIYFTVIFLPTWQHWISLAILLGGFALFLSGIYQHIFYVTRQLAFNYHKLNKFSLAHGR